MSLIRFLSLPFIISIASCQKEVTCQVYKKRFYGKEANIIVLDKGPIGNSLVVKGVNLITRKNTIYTDVDGIYNYVYNNLEIGDTLIKKRNSATFTIKKKKATILISYNCLAGNYAESGILDTLPKLTYGKMTVDTIPKNNLH